MPYTQSIVFARAAVKAGPPSQRCQGGEMRKFTASGKAAGIAWLLDGVDG